MSTPSPSGRGRGPSRSDGRVRGYGACRPITQVPNPSTSHALTGAGPSFSLWEKAS